MGSPAISLITNRNPMTTLDSGDCETDINSALPFDTPLDRTILFATFKPLLISAIAE